MEPRELRRRLVVNADDFGLSAEVNEAVVRAHRDGVLTTASLMVSGECWEEAVELAHRNPRLGVGLHLVLVCGRSVLAREHVAGLVDVHGKFSEEAVRAGWRYFFRRRLRAELEEEIGAQIARFRDTGLVMDHVNGHLNMHMHPTIYRVLMRRAKDWGLRAVRITQDSLRLQLACGSGTWGYVLSHALMFGCLSRWCRARLHAAGLRATGRVFGLLQNGQVTEEYLLRLVERLPAGDHELYAHPCTGRFRHELEALTSGRVRERLDALGIARIRYQDLDYG